MTLIIENKKETNAHITEVYMPQLTAVNIIAGKTVPVPGNYTGGIVKVGYKENNLPVGYKSCEPKSDKLVLFRMGGSTGEIALGSG